MGVPNSQWSRYRDRIVGVSVTPNAVGIGTGSWECLTPNGVDIGTGL